MSDLLLVLHAIGVRTLVAILGLLVVPWVVVWALVFRSPGKREYTAHRRKSPQYARSRWGHVYRVIPHD